MQLITTADLQTQETRWNLSHVWKCFVRNCSMTTAVPSANCLVNKSKFFSRRLDQTSIDFSTRLIHLQRSVLLSKPLKGIFPEAKPITGLLFPFTLERKQIVHLSSTVNTEPSSVLPALIEMNSPLLEPRSADCRRARGFAKYL